MDFWKIRIKIMLKDKYCLIWTFLFPIVLSAFILLALSAVDNVELNNSTPIKAVMCLDENNDNELVTFLKNAETPEHEKMFQIIVCSEEDAAEMLNEKLITGYIVPGSKIKLYVKNTGEQETVLETAINRYAQTKKVFHNEANSTTIVQEILGNNEYIKYSGGESSVSQNASYFFSVIGLTCIMGVYWGMKVAILNRKDSMPGKRCFCIPGARWFFYIQDTLLGFILHALEITVIIMVIRKASGNDFGMNLFLMLGTSYLGSMNGILLGQVIVLYGKGSILSKYNTGLQIGLFLTLLSGLVLPEVKYSIEERMPLLSWINPVSLIYDAYYSMYVEGSFTHYMLKIIVLLFLSMVCLGFIIAGVRRQNNEAL